MKTFILLVTLAAVCPALANTFPGEQWERDTPESQDVNTRKLRQAIWYLERQSGTDGATELVIVRNGILIWEGESAGKVHGVWSMTKSFTSTVLGILIQEGKCMLNSPAHQWAPDMAETYPKVTLRNFTTMTSGYRAIGDEPRGEYAHGPSLTPFQPSPTPLFDPGQSFAYWDSAMNQFGLILTRIAGESLEDIFRSRIANPIGMDPDGWSWGYLVAPDKSKVNGGSGNCNAHLFTCAREAARMGLLFLNKGNWNGKQLINADWVTAATRVQVPASLPTAGPITNGPGLYGYNWWVNGTGPEGNRKWPAAPVGTYSASGYNNNDMFVIPEWDMVIVRLGLDQQEKPITDEVYSGFLGKVGAALQSK